MQNDRMFAVANSYWAAQFGCSPEELFSRPFQLVTHSAELADYDGAFAMFRNAAVAASVPAYCADQLRELLSVASTGCSPAVFADALSSVSARVVGPAYIGYATSIAEPAHSAHLLGSGDAAALCELQQSCDPREWEHGGCSPDGPTCGVFAGRQLVAVASYEVWGGAIAHISIVTHPEFRGCGFGRSAVAHLAKLAAGVGLLPQYRTLESNQASVCVAKAIGFHRYATTMAVRLHCDNQTSAEASQRT